VTKRRRRGVLLLSVALVSGGLAASEVHERERTVEEQVGAPVEVLVAARDIRAGVRIQRGALALRRVPARFVPPDALGSAAGVVGARSAAAVVAGGYITAGMLERASDEHRGGGAVGRGRRAVTVAVAGGGALVGLTQGERVDVLVSTEPGADGGRTLMALAGVELLHLEPGASDAFAGAEPAGPETTALATLRVTLGQAVYLTAADNFAREIRLLARPAGDHRRAGTVVSQAEL
jgi:pilus assembly protein CpaB